MSSITVKCYLSLNDVEAIYIYLNGSTNGLTSFRNEAKKVAIKRGRYEFRNEEKLFNIFQMYLSEILEKKKISSFGELMQYLPNDMLDFM